MNQPLWFVWHLFYTLDIVPTNQTTVSKQWWKCLLHHGKTIHQSPFLINWLTPLRDRRHCSLHASNQQHRLRTWLHTRLCNCWTLHTASSQHAVPWRAPTTYCQCPTTNTHSCQTQNECSLAEQQTHTHTRPFSSSIVTDVLSCRCTVTTRCMTQSSSGLYKTWYNYSQCFIFQNKWRRKTRGQTADAGSSNVVCHNKLEWLKSANVCNIQIWLLLPSDVLFEQVKEES